MTPTQTNHALTAAEYGRFWSRALGEIAVETVRDPPRDDGRVRLSASVSDWLEANYDDALGEYDPGRVSQVVPVEPDDVDARGTIPMSESDGDGERQRLYAYRAVRADLLAELDDASEDLATAIAVHDALERLVGAHGESTDRRPAEVVEAFTGWVADRADEPTARRAGEAFTVLHVMRIAVVDVFEGDDLATALAAWFDDEHSTAFDPDATTVER